MARSFLERLGALLGDWAASEEHRGAEHAGTVETASANRVPGATFGGEKQGGVVLARQLGINLSLTFSVINFSHNTECPDLGVICLTRQEPEITHHLKMYFLEFRPSFEYGP